MDIPYHFKEKSHIDRYPLAELRYGAMKAREEQTFSTEVTRRLDLIIALLLDLPEPDSVSTMTDKIAKLLELGASPAQVAQILQKPLNYITASMAMRRKAKHSG